MPRGSLHGGDRVTHRPLHRLRAALLLAAVTSTALVAVLNTAVRTAERWAATR